MLLRDDDFNNIVKIVQNKTLKNIEDWKKLAKDVNGLLDLPVIAYTTSGKLTNEMKKKYWYYYT